MRAGLRSRFVALVAVVGYAATAEAVTLSDATFANVDWGAFLVIDTSPNPGLTSFTAGQVATGGNGGPYREWDVNWTGPGGPNVGHILLTTSVDPQSLGGIADIAMTFEVNVFNAPFIGGTGYRALARQNSTFYVSTQNFIATANSWTSNTFSAVTFVKLGTGPGGSTLDTSATGLPIEFGYLSRVNPSTAVMLNNVSGVDNWAVTVTAVPEPSTALLLASGLVAMAVGRRRRAL